MNAERTCSMRRSAPICLLNRATEIFQGTQRFVERRSHRGRVVAGNPTLNEKPLECRSTVFVVLHDVVPDAAVNVNIDQPGSEDAVTKVNVLRATREFSGGTRSEAGNRAIFGS